MRRWISRLPLVYLLLLPPLLVLVPGIVVAGIYLKTSWQAAVERGWTQSRTVAELTGAEISHVLRDFDEILGMLAERPLIQAMDPERCDPILADVTTFHPLLSAVTVRDLAGRLICSSLPTAVQQLPDEQLAMVQVGASHNRIYATDAVMGASSGRWIAGTTYPLHDADGAVTGLLLAPIDLERWNEELFPGFSDSTIVTVFGRDRNVLLRSSGFDDWVGKALPSRITNLIQENERTGYFRSEDIAGDPRIGAYITLDGTDWVVGLGFLETEVLAPYQRQLIGTIIAGIAVLVLLIALVWWLTRVIRDPVRDLVEVSRAVASGRPLRANVTGPREIQQVARQFNQMLDSLARVTEERVALAHHVDTVTQNSPDAILLSDPQGRIVEANAVAADLYEYKPSDLYQRQLTELRVGNDDTQPARAVTTNNQVSIREEEHRRSDGSVFPAEVRSRVISIEGRDYLQTFIRDITERRDRERQLRSYADRVKRMFASTVESISALVEQRDPYTAGHERRVSMLAVAIAAEMGLDTHVQEGLAYAAALHDVGKIAIPSELLTKPGRLTPVELALVRTHAERGYESLRWIDSPWPIAEVARQHHERMDGSGYPRGLKGDEILLEARIVAVADVVESMTSHRPYRPGLGIERALKEIEAHRGTLYDPAVADACLRLFRARSFALPEQKAA